MPDVKHSDIVNGLIHHIFIAVYFTSVVISMRQVP